MATTAHPMPDGKELIVRETNTYQSELSIRNGDKVIKVGLLNKQTKELIVFRKRAIHEHHRTRSYGFNSWLLHNSKLIQKIRIYEDNDGVNNEYLVSKSSIIEQGVEMDFISELQIFYPIKNLETFHRV